MQRPSLPQRARADRAPGGVADAARLAARSRRRVPRGTRTNASAHERGQEGDVIRKLANGKYRLYSRKKDPKTGKRKNLGTFDTRAAAEKHERAVQYFKRRG